MILEETQFLRISPALLVKPGKAPTFSRGQLGSSSLWRKAWPLVSASRSPLIAPVPSNNFCFFLSLFLFSLLFFFLSVFIGNSIYSEAEKVYPTLNDLTQKDIVNPSGATCGSHLGRELSSEFPSKEAVMWAAWARQLPWVMLWASSWWCEEQEVATCSLPVNTMHLSLAGLSQSMAIR